MKRRISTSDIWADFCAALTSYDGGMTVEQLLNDGWQFCKLPLGSTLEDVSNAALQAVDLPHDFLIENENDLYETTDAWYLRTLDVPESWCASCVLVRFDGVYMDCDVLLNGHIVCTHHYGYTAFDVDLTSRLLVGRNTLAVHVRHQSPNSRWYSGAGIYRPVVLWTADKQQHIALNGVRIRTVSINPATVEVTVRTVGAGRVSVDVLAGEKQAASAAADTTGEVTLTLTVPNAKLWDVEHPNLYTCRVRFGSDEDLQTFGIRTLSWGKRASCSTASASLCRARASTTTRASSARAAMRRAKSAASAC